MVRRWIFLKNMVFDLINSLRWFHFTLQFSYLSMYLLTHVLWTEKSIKRNSNFLKILKSIPAAPATSLGKSNRKINQGKAVHHKDSREGNKHHVELHTDGSSSIHSKLINVAKSQIKKEAFTEEQISEGSAVQRQFYLPLPQKQETLCKKTNRNIKLHTRKQKRIIISNVQSKTLPIELSNRAKFWQKGWSRLLMLFCEVSKQQEVEVFLD